MASLPPQRRQPGGPGGGPGGRAGRNNLSTREGVEEAERRLGKACFHAGQKVLGTFACVACQFQIRNRGTLPTCPDCGEIVWAYMEDGPRPVPEGEQPGAAAPAPSAPPVTVQEGVSLSPPAPIVQEGVKLQP
jgi:predicted RNA-binding Zn-ribbon protein involved in translation (DUF1610 family)